MGEELGDDAQAVRLKTVDGLVVVRKRFLKQVGPHPVQLAEPLSDHTVELLVGPLLASALYNHGSEFVLQTLWQVDSHQLVYTLLETTTALDG